jgi:hypothetical protein
VLRYPLIHPPPTSPSSFAAAAPQAGDDRLYANLLLTIGYITPARGEQ